VVNAIIAGLSQMRNATFPLKNITVYDDRMESFMRNAGFTIQNNPDDYKIISTYQKTDAFWGNTVHIVHGVQQRLSRITEEADYIINVPVLKDHSNAGITFALKNSYGMVDAPGTMHDNWCDPYIAALYAVIASKVRLIVGDAIFGVYKGGPATGPNCMPNTILVGTDPVAIDMYALTMINTERTNRGMYAISTSQDPANPSRADARHLLTAASSDYNLGSINKKIFEVVL
jgi:uncharacterized protein (DUF362 family)